MQNNNTIPTNQTNNTNPQGTKLVQEDPQVVAQKSNKAVKVLADNIGDMYRQKLIKEGKLQDQSINTLQAQGDKSLKQLSELIADKFRFGKLPNQVVNPTPAPAPTPVPNNNAEIERLRREKEELARQRTQLDADRNALNKELGRYQDEKIGDYLLGHVNQNQNQNQHINYGGRGSHVIQERRGDPTIRTNVYENTRGTINPNSRGGANNEISLVNEEGVVRTQVTDKTFDVIVERPVVREIIVEKPYDVIVERPVENRIEREIITEQYIDNPIERIIENQVERIIQKPVERIIERPVISERIVEKKIENIIERHVDVIREVQVPFTRTVERSINRTIVKPYRKEIQTREVVVEEPIYEEVIVEKPVHRYIERFVDVPETEYVEREYIKEVDVPIKKDIIKEIRVSRNVQKVIDVPDIQRVKKSIKVQKIVERPYEVITEVEKPVRRTIRKEVEVPIYVDRIVEKAIDKIVERPYYVDKKIEVPIQVEVEKEIEIERFEDVYIEQVREIAIQREKYVEIEVAKHVAKYVEVPREIYKDVPVRIEVEIPVEREVERTVRVEKRIPRRVEVEKIVEVIVDRYIDKTITIDKIVEKPVFIEKIIEKPVQRIIEKIVEVPVERIVQVPREIRKDRIIEVSTFVEKPIYIEKEVNDNTHVTVTKKNERLRTEIRKSVDVMTTLRREEEEWRRKLEESRLRFKLTEFSTQTVESTIGFEENQRLRERLDYLHEEYNSVIDRQNREKTEAFRGSVKNIGMGNRREVSRDVSNANITTTTHYRKSLGAMTVVGGNTINVVNRPSEIRTSTYVNRTEEANSRRITRKYDANGNLIDENVENLGGNNGNWTQSNVYGQTNGNYNGNVVYTGGQAFNQSTTFEVVKRLNPAIVNESEVSKINYALGRYTEDMIRKDQQ